VSDLIHLLQQVPLHDKVKQKIVTRLNEPHRHFHNLDHVVQMWRWHTELSHGRFDDGVVASFCLYHDAVYDPLAYRGNNEEKSANLWLEASLAVAPATRQQTDSAILASADHFNNRCEQHVGDCTLCWCLDLDLMSLGSSDEQFVQFGRKMRAEYTHLSDLAWIKKSAEFRAKVMAQPRIFVCELLGDFELQARRNLTKALMQDWLMLGYLHDVPFRKPDHSHDLRGDQLTST